jgi:hypothetical protein
MLGFYCYIWKLSICHDINLNLNFKCKLTIMKNLSHLNFRIKNYMKEIYKLLK